MRSHRHLIVLLGTLLGTVVMAWGQNPLDAVFARMDTVAAKFKGMSANIKQVEHADVIHEEDVKTGTIKMKRLRPHEVLLRLDLQDAQGSNPQQVVVNGGTARVFYPNNPGEIQEYQLGRHKSLVDQYMALGFGGTSSDLRAAYAVKMGGPETVAGEATTRLELTPKLAEVLDTYKRIDLWVSDKGGYVVQQKLYEAGKDYQLITYTNIELNPTIPDSVFHLEVPKGTKRDVVVKGK